MRFSLPNSTNLPVFVAKCIFRDIIFLSPILLFKQHGLPLNPGLCWAHAITNHYDIQFILLL